MFESEFAKLCEKGNASDACLEGDIADAEQQLSVEFPKQYRDFLSSYGSCFFPGAEIFGLPNLEKNNPPMWQNVVEVTNELRKWKQAGSEDLHFIPISEDGMGTYFYLDTKESPATKIVAVGPGIEKHVSSDLFEFFVRLSKGEIVL